MVKDRGRAFTVLRSLVGTGGEDTRCLPSQDQQGRIRTYQLAGSFISLVLIVLLGSKIESESPSGPKVTSPELSAIYI